ncbi:nucleoside hydrolase [Aestuariicella hydrocarbonica]|uniref:Nucleoside hydrolase n=2 Tax=Pseudomaricurvus hydrocarbonicus TaxID=1470433 RepID=A0A9E5MP06_9GAMM|nr:nucleoside hydrolase [Aestuariicella hydrocarbonica]
MKHMALGLALSCVAAHVVAAEKRKVILDDDGFAVAQWMVIQDPGVDVLGVTQVSGNRWLGWNVQWALRALELANRSDIPVYAGATFPLLNTEKSTELWEQRYGKLIWKGAWQKEWVEETEQSTPTYHAWNEIPDLVEGNPTHTAKAEHAANFMIRMVRTYPGEVSIIATGPLTNIALAQSLDPEFASLAKELVYMGGSLNPRQRLDNKIAGEFAREFVNSPRREFNWLWDPEAVRMALRAPWKKIVMVPVDPSTTTQLTPKLLKAMAKQDNAVAKVVSTREANFPLWDDIASGVWLDPTLITESTDLYVDAVVEFGPNYGDTLSWAPGYQPEQGETLQQVVQTVDTKGLEKLMVQLMNRPLPE